MAIVANRATTGGPQPAELDRMPDAANRKLAEQDAWTKVHRAHIDASLDRLDADFAKLLAKGK